MLIILNSSKICFELLVKFKALLYICSIILQELQCNALILRNKYNHFK